MDSLPPSVPKGFNLLGLAGDVASIAIFNVTTCRGPLEVAVKLNPIRRIEIDAMYFTAETFALCEAGHDLERIAKDHTVGPVLVVLIELGFIHPLGHAV